MMVLLRKALISDEQILETIKEITIAWIAHNSECLETTKAIEAMQLIHDKLCQLIQDGVEGEQ